MTYDEPPLRFAFKSNLRRFAKGDAAALAEQLDSASWQGLTIVNFSAQPVPFSLYP